MLCVNELQQPRGSSSSVVEMRLTAPARGVFPERLRKSSPGTDAWGCLRAVIKEEPGDVEMAGAVAPENDYADIPDLNRPVRAGDDAWAANLFPGEVCRDTCKYPQGRRRMIGAMRDPFQPEVLSWRDPGPSAPKPSRRRRRPRIRKGPTPGGPQRISRASQLHRREQARP